MLKSISRLSHISEVIICYQHEEFATPVWEEIQNGVVVHRVYLDYDKARQESDNPVWKGPLFLRRSYAHAMSLHRALEDATSEYILFSDADVVFTEDITAVYLAKIDNGCDIAGVSHYAPGYQCYLSFPCVINFFIKKENLPDSSWLKGYLKARNHLVFYPIPDVEEASFPPLDGAWLAQTAIPEYAGLFPHPGGNYDIGCNLYLWAVQNNFKWYNIPVGDDQETYFLEGKPLLLHYGPRKLKVLTSAVYPLPIAEDGCPMFSGEDNCQHGYSGASQIKSAIL